MNEPQRLVGTYLLGLEPLLVSTVGPELLVRLGGVPEELAARLVGSGNSYVVNGSQLEGATLDFRRGRSVPTWSHRCAVPTAFSRRIAHRCRNRVLKSTPEHTGRC